MKNIHFFILAVIAFAIGFLTANGIVQKVIKFDGILNEMSFTVLAFVIGVVCIMGLDWRTKEEKL